MKLKNLLIALLMIIGTTLMAQEKYEQGTVEQASLLCVTSLEGKPVVKQKLTAAEAADAPCLKKLAELREQGWEVWNSAAQPAGNVYFIRRKIK